VQEMDILDLLEIMVEGLEDHQVVEETQEDQVAYLDMEVAQDLEV